jgi:hypothetical protein
VQEYEAKQNFRPHIEIQARFGLRQSMKPCYWPTGAPTALKEAEQISAERVAGKIEIIIRPQGRSQDYDAKEREAVAPEV